MPGSVAFPFKGSDSNTYTGQTVPTDTSGNVPVSATTWPLPVGAATSVLQTTGNTALAAIQTAVTTPALPTGASTSALQTAMNAALTTLGTDGGLATIGLKADTAPANPTASGSVVGVLKGIWAALLARLPLDTNGNLKQVLYDATGAAVSYGGTTTVQGLAGGVAVPVSLPATAATAALQTTANTSLAAIQTAVTTPALATGAAIAAKQPALGTAGTPAADVITVQGATGGLALAADTVIRSAAANRGGLSTVKAVSATVSAGGSGYAVGDTITNAAGVFTVGTVTSGAVTGVTATTPTALTATPASPLAQTATSGAGTGATLSPAYAPAAFQFAAINTSRRGFSIQNQSSGSLWFSGIGTATTDQNSFVLLAGDYFESSPQHSGTGALSIIGTSAGQAFYAREF